MFFLFRLPFSLLGLVIFFFAVAPVLTLTHELGHALPALYYDSSASVRVLIGGLEADPSATVLYSGERFSVEVVSWKRPWAGHVLVGPKHHRPVAGLEWKMALGGLVASLLLLGFLHGTLRLNVSAPLSVSNLGAAYWFALAQMFLAVFPFSYPLGLRNFESRDQRSDVRVLIDAWRTR